MAALLSRVGGGGGVVALTSAATLRGGGRTSNGSSAFFSAAAARVLSPLHRPQTALLFFPSPPPPGASERCRHLSCFSPHASQEETGPSGTAAVAAEEEGTAIPPPPASAAALREAAAQLDLRVGRVLRAWRHPEADSLYVEEVDVGEAEPRTICSGLVGYVPLEVLQGAPVVVLANLKPRSMRGVKSNGMLLAASDAAHETVDLLVAPEGAVPGERIWFGAAEDHKEEQPEPATPNQVQKKKIWESVQPHLKTGENFVAMLGIHPMQTSAGVVVCRSLKNARVS